MKLHQILSLMALVILLAACGEKQQAGPNEQEAAKPGAIAEGTPRTYTEAPVVAMMTPVQAGEVSGTRKVDQWIVGPELAPGESAVSDTMIEAFHPGDYKALDEGTTVTVVRTADDPGQKGSGDFALKVIRETPGVSGVTSDKALIQFNAGERYLVRCKINAGEQAGNWKLGMNEPDGTILWAKKPNGGEAFTAEPGQWTQLTGVFDADKDVLVSLQIIRDGETAQSWYFDDVSVCQIYEDMNP